MKRRKTDTITDGILNKVTGRKIQTILISLDEMTDMIDRFFIQQAGSDDEKKEIYKVCKGGLFTKRISSHDGRYEIRVERFNRPGLFGYKDMNFMYLHDISTDTYYKYHAILWGKLKRAVAAKL